MSREKKYTNLDSEEMRLWKKKEQVLSYPPGKIIDDFADNFFGDCSYFSKSIASYFSYLAASVHDFN